MEKPIRLKCVFQSDHTKQHGYVNHYISEDSDCAREERYKIREVIHESDHNLHTVYCFDCILKTYCKGKNCTNELENCRICGEKSDICFDCINSVYKRCCKNCTPCNSCFEIHPHSGFYSCYEEELPEPREVPCSLCEKLVCSEKIHQLLDCELSSGVPDIREVTDCLIFFRKQILELKLHLLEVENVSYSAEQTAEYAENNTSRLESNLEWSRSRSHGY